MVLDPCHPSHLFLGPCVLVLLRKPELTVSVLVLQALGCPQKTVEGSFQHVVNEVSHVVVWKGFGPFV